MWTPESEYLLDIGEIIYSGERTENRTGVATLREIGLTHHYDFKYGFPLFTTKKVWFKGIVHELLWFLQGSTNIKYLVDNDVHIWDDDAYKFYCRNYNEAIIGEPLSKTKGATKEGWLKLVKEYPHLFGDLGPVYGAQWREWQGDRREFKIDQIATLVKNLKEDPQSRRHILSAWNPTELNQMALPPCHVLAQFTIRHGNKLWCQMYQRSCDMFLGVPFNVASYSLLTHMLAQVTGLEPGGFIWTGHDCHVYETHKEAVLEQIKREPIPFPKLVLNSDIKNIDDFRYEDIKIENYLCHEAIKVDLVT